MSLMASQWNSLEDILDFSAITSNQRSVAVEVQCVDIDLNSLCMVQIFAKSFQRSVVIGELEKM